MGQMMQQEYDYEPRPPMLWPEDPSGPQPDGDDEDDVQPLHQWRPTGSRHEQEGGAAMSKDLVAFLRARLDEDEAADWHAYDCAGMDFGAGCGCGVPEHKSREVAAIRAVVDLHRPEPGQHPDFCGHDLRELPCPTLRRLAAIWRDHPDYDPAWAPS